MRESTNKIPEFKNLTEEAVFWDTHDTADFEDEFEEIEVEFEPPLIRRGLTIVLEEPYLSQIKQLAEQKGSQPNTLIQQWVVERLQEIAV